MMEEWRAIPGYEGLYEVSDIGRVRSLPRWVNNHGGRRFVPEKILSLHVNTRRGNYRSVMLANEGRTERHRIHVLVLRAFVGERPSPIHHGLHRDDDPANNYLSNLRWGLPAENEEDKRINGGAIQGSRSRQAKLTETDIPIILKRAETEFHRVIASDYGVNRQTIDKIVRGQRWKHITLATAAQL